MLFKISELAQRWSCTARSITELIHSGRLSAFPLNPDAKRKTWRVTAESVRLYEAGQGVMK